MNNNFQISRITHSFAKGIPSGNALSLPMLREDRQEGRPICPLLGGVG